ncbi:SCO1 protein [Xylariomycetidae sp. FL0641]|nr:SCO1 protein [Xylariomycetidae sp. FL0641]
MSRSVATAAAPLRALLRSRGVCPSTASCSSSSIPATITTEARRAVSSIAGSRGARPVLTTTPTPTQQQRRHKTHGRTVEEQKSRYRTGPFSWKAGLLFVVTAAGLTWYFESEKQRMQRKRIQEATKGVGKAKVGGEFELVDQDGNRFTSQDLKGRHALIYFGFTHCPDICPEELDKMARMYDLVEADRPGALKPVFITCDPARDDPKILKQYLAEFHPGFIGLTGTYEQIRDVCKAYRVYFSTPQDVAPGQDYLVDHSIYFYLMDPEGDFIEALGRQHSPQEGAKLILDHIRDWKR